VHKFHSKSCRSYIRFTRLTSPRPINRSHPHRRTNRRFKELTRFPDIVPPHREELKLKAEEEVSENKRNDLIKLADRTVRQTVEMMFRAGLALDVNPGDNGADIPKSAAEFRAAFDSFDFQGTGNDDDANTDGDTSYHVEHVDGELATCDVSLAKCESIVSLCRDATRAGTVALMWLDALHTSANVCV
jgi:hypothetical protein